MAKWIAAEKAKAGLRHAVVCPNMTGRTKERIAQSKRDRAGSLALVDYYSHKWRELVSSRRMSCCLSLVLHLFCFVSLPLPTSFFSFFRCFFLGDVAFSGYFYFFTPLPFSLCMESTSYVFPFWVVFFYLVTTGGIFDISLCENLINQINYDNTRQLDTAVHYHISIHYSTLLFSVYYT